MYTYTPTTRICTCTSTRQSPGVLPYGGMGDTSIMSPGYGQTNGTGTGAGMGGGSGGGMGSGMSPRFARGGGGGPPVTSILERQASSAGAGAGESSTVPHFLIPSYSLLLLLARRSSLLATFSSLLLPSPCRFLYGDLSPHSLLHPTHHSPPAQLITSPPNHTHTNPIHPPSHPPTS